MLAGVGAAVLPVVLHLLSRARLRRVEWGAMLFVQDTTMRQKARTRLSQWLILLMRILALAALAIALARPVSRGVAGRGGNPAATVLVIDASASTGYVEAGGARFEQVRQAALSALGALPRGAQAGLVLLGAAGEDVPLTGDLQDIASHLAAQQAGGGSADLAEGTLRATALLKSAGQPAGTIILIADRQSATWADLPSIPRDPAIAVIATAVGAAAGENALVAWVHLLTKPPVVGQPLEIEVRLRNDGTHDLTHWPLAIRQNDRVIEQRHIDLPAMSSRNERATITINRAGSAVLVAALEPTGMPADDRAAVAIDVAPPINVYVITGEPAELLAPSPRRDLSGATDLLRAALTPRATGGEKGDDAFRFGIAPQANWPGLNRAAGGVLVLAGIEKLSEQQRREVEQFVYSGNGLLLVPGAGQSAKQWNEDYWRGGSGVAPAEAIAVGSAPSQPVALAKASRGHPAIPFAADAPLPSAQVVRWLRFAPTAAATAILSLQNGDPWMIERSFGRGRVVAVATPLDGAWSDVGFSNLFLPAMQSTIRYLCAQRDEVRNIPIGGAISHRLAAGGEREASVVRPDGRVDRVAIANRDGAGEVTYLATDTPGRYIVRAAGEAPADFIVASDRKESNLNMLDDTALDALLARSPVRRAAPDAIATQLASVSGPSEWSLPVLAAVVAFLIIEMTLASRADAAAGGG